MPSTYDALGLDGYPTQFFLQNQGLENLDDRIGKAAIERTLTGVHGRTDSVTGRVCGQPKMKAKYITR